MKKDLSFLLLLPLKVFTVLALVLAPAFMFLSFKAKNIYADLWQQLGTTKEKGIENMQTSFIYDYFNYYGAEKAKNLALGDRAAVAKDLMQFTKEYINSEAFKTKYADFRNSVKPEEPMITNKTKEDIRKEKIAETEKSISSIEESMKKLPDMAKSFQPSLDMMKNYLKDYKDPNSANIEMYYKADQMEQQYKMTDYKSKMLDWEKNYPADYKQLVKLRLQKFVETARTVDYNAELQLVNGKKKFVKPAYESKGTAWKQMFRAGKEVMVPSLAFAEQWLKELN